MVRSNRRPRWTVERVVRIICMILNEIIKIILAWHGLR